MDEYGIGFPDPLDQQRAAAQMLRRNQAQSRLRTANEDANKFNTLAAIAAMSNNEGAANAAALAAKNQQARFKPVSMGTQGFALPSSGDFISSPMYEDEREATRQQQRSLAQQRSDDAKEALARRQEFQAGENERNRQLRMTLLSLQEAGRNDRNQARIDAKADAGGGGKVLPASNVEKFTKNQGTAEAFLGLNNTFKDEYSGTPGLADLQNIGGRFGVSKYGDQANWWQNYQEQTNQVRHQLFGSALTAPEKAAFDKATIVPGMAPAQIRTRLAQQARAVASAQNKLKKNFGAAGYNMSGFEDMDVPEAPAPGGKAPAAKLPQLNLPPGFRIVGEAP